MMCPVETPPAAIRNVRREGNGQRRGAGIMKKIVLGAALAVGLLALCNGRASAVGFGGGNGFGISPGSSSVGLGFNVAWSGISFGPGYGGGGGGGGPCYGG